MADNVKTDQFDKEVLESEQPVLDQIAQERSDLRVVKLNIDEEPSIAQRYGVMSIPTLILFKDGEPQAAAVGAMPKSMIEQRLGLAEAAA